MMKAVETFNATNELTKLCGVKKRLVEERHLDLAELRGIDPGHKVF